jgi:hypothetical protein
VNAVSCGLLLWVLLAFLVDGLHRHPKYQDIFLLSIFTMIRAAGHVVRTDWIRIQRVLAGYGYEYQDIFCLAICRCMGPDVEICKTSST